MPEPAPSLGEFIRAQRELSEMSMREFARVAGISNPYLSQIERGLRAPSEQVMQAIADTLKVSSDTLYEHAGVAPESDGESAVLRAIREDRRLDGPPAPGADPGLRGVRRGRPQPARARRAPAATTPSPAAPRADGLNAERHGRARRPCRSEGEL